MGHAIRVAPAALLIGLAVAAAACTADGSRPEATSPADAPTATSTMATAITTITTVTGTEVSPDTSSAIVDADVTLSLTEVGTGFDAPVLLVADPDGGAELIVEQSGRIVRNDNGHTVVLDIRDDVTFKGEQGLLGVAFHPRFRENQLAYINYVNRSRATVIEQYQYGDGVFDIASRQTILTIEQPASNHNGGMIAFGPDGYLWIGMGDGGFADDRLNNAQDAQSLLGAMLRIDVGGLDGVPYRIPPDNPFHDGVDGAPEIWGIGLRNPWRFSFDGDHVWIADVGQNDFEEVNTVLASEPGMNFGWPIMEGTACFGSSACDATGTVQPVAEYQHDEGCSITGGYVYRGEAIPQLQGQYFFADFCSGFLRSYSQNTGITDWTDMVGETPSVAGFGIGSDRELYMVSHAGTVFRLDAAR